MQRLIVVSLVLALCGCSETSRETDAGVDAFDDGSTQDAGGDDVGADDGVTGDEDCLATGSACLSNQDCCSGRCAEGICLGETGLCKAMGEECSASSECCSGRCEANPAGVKVCVVGGGCAGLGEACLMAVDCCSLSCVGGVCDDDQLCELIGGECAADLDCCSNSCSDQGACLAAGEGCITTGELCGGSDGACCSGACVDIDGTFRCVSNSVCRAEGDVCDQDADCCSGVCGADGRCPELAECQTVGEPCTGFHECCSGVCADPGTGTPICQFPSGCRSIGEICLVDDDCCGAICVDVGDTGVRRCEKPAGCLASGEVCGGSAFGNSYNCCPSGPDGGEQLCLPTDIGITRCYGETTHDECLEDDQPCAFSDECCNGYCLPDENGELVCGSTCVDQGGVCTTHADCCEDMVCEDGVCAPNPYGCTPVGGACQEAEECCTGSCMAGICVVA